ncbi:MAG: transglutaminase family protein [Herpetosiphonaceae bacterium]|nr:transglutaminase family protein [Herpetosiphonaceae bacterium]
MYYAIRHVTQFRYSAPITESVMEVRMQPRRDGNQHCLSFELVTNPRSRITASRDYLGNIVHHFDIPGQHSQLTITAQATVSVTAPRDLGVLRADAWNQLDALVADSDAAEMLIPSHFVRFSPALEELARELDVRRRDDPLTVLRDSMTGIHKSFAYRPQSTLVDSPIEEVLRIRQGVCQDYAHVMIALARNIGIPCRYVSGYLYRRITDADRVGADATHAWVEALLPDAGWVGFDPTNDMVVGERHIRTAVGRDYADVPPDRGVFRGQARTELAVAVQVSLADEAPVDDELTLVMQKLPPEIAGEQPQQQQQSGTYAATQMYAMD